MDNTAYRELLEQYMKEKFSPQDVRDLGKYFELTFEIQEYPKEKKNEMIQILIETIFEQNRLYALFCILKQFKKYHKEGCDELIKKGEPFASVPVDIRRPQIELSVECEEAETKKSPHKLVRFHEDIRFRENLKAIVIGVGKDIYGNDNGSTCENDANAIVEFLKNEWKIKEENIYSLIGYVTGKEARAKLKEICDKADENDNLLFYFAGYGMGLCGKSYLMTSDSYIHVKTVRNSLRLISINEILRSCKAKVKIRIFDANYSGQRLEELALTVEENAAEITNIDFYGDTMPEKMRKEVLATGSDWITFTACDTDQKSYEAKNLNHSVFTYYLLKGLKDAGARRRNKNFYVEDLKVYTCKKVMEAMDKEGIRQIPQYQCELNGNVLME